MEKVQTHLASQIKQFVESSGSVQAVFKRQHNGTERLLQRQHIPQHFHSPVSVDFCQQRQIGNHQMRTELRASIENKSLQILSLTATTSTHLQSCQSVDIENLTLNLAPSKTVRKHVHWTPTSNSAH